MKNIALLILILILPTFSFSQDIDDLKILVEKSIKKAKEQSLYSSEIDWKMLEERVLSESKNLDSISDLKIPLTTLLNGMRDHHGRFFYEGQAIAWFTDSPNTRSTDTRKYDSDVWNKVTYEAKKDFQILNKNIGYIKIVGIGPQQDIEREAQDIRDHIQKCTDLGIKRWIIDLRSNGGGTMYPMLEGLGPIIGDGLIGREVNLQEETLTEWFIKDQSFLYGDYQAMDLDPIDIDSKEQEVVVLLSKYTVSSGEIVATAFKGRKNTHFIGEATGGYTTVNNYEPISDSLFMVISVAYYADRTGHIYKENIGVDNEVQFIYGLNYSDDKGIQEAIQSLK